MSKILASGIIALLAGSVSTVKLVRIIPNDGDSLPELCFATKNITVTAWDGGSDRVFVGKIISEGGLGTFEQSIDISEGGNIATVGTMKVVLSNPQYTQVDDQDVRFDEYIATYTLEGRKVEIWLALTSDDTVDYDDLILVHTFVVSDYSYDYSEFTLSLESLSVTRHKLIPEEILSQKDHPNIPASNIGKVAPLLYGELSHATWGQSISSYVPCICVDQNCGRYLVSQNKLFPYMDLYPVCIYYADADRYGTLMKVLSANHPPEDVVFGRPTTFTLKKIEDVSGENESPIYAYIVSRCNAKGSQCDPVDKDLGHLFDNKSTTYITIGAGEKVYVRCPFPANPGKLLHETLYQQVVLGFHVSFYGVFSGAGTVKYYNPRWDNGVGGFSTGEAISGTNGFTYDFGADKSAHGSADDQSDQYDPWTIDEILDLEFGVEMTSGSEIFRYMHLAINRVLVATEQPISEWIVVARRPGSKKPRMWRQREIEPFNSLESHDMIYVNSMGATFPDWIEDSGRSQTTWHEDDDAIGRGGGSVYIIEAIYRDELGLTSAEIDMDAFDALGEVDESNRRRYDYLGNIINTQKDSRQIIGQICQQLRIVQTLDQFGRESVKLFGYDPTLDSARIIDTIDRTTMIEGTAKVDLSPLDEVYNSFEVAYMRLWHNGAFAYTYYLNRNGDNLYDADRPVGIESDDPVSYPILCQTSYIKYGFERKLYFEASWIDRGNPGLSETTAENLIKWLCEWFCFRKYIFTWESGLDHLELEIGDLVKIDHDLLPPDLRGVAAFMVTGIKYDVGSDKTKYTCWQIPDFLQ